MSNQVKSRVGRGKDSCERQRNHNACGLVCAAASSRGPGESSGLQGQGWGRQETQVTGGTMPGIRPGEGMSRILKQEISRDVRTCKVLEHVGIQSWKQVKTSGSELIAEVFWKLIFCGVLAWVS